MDVGVTVPCYKEEKDAAMDEIVTGEGAVYQGDKPDKEGVVAWQTSLT